jgi:hypothetical protein
MPGPNDRTMRVISGGPLPQPSAPWPGFSWFTAQPLAQVTEWFRGSAMAWQVARLEELELRTELRRHQHLPVLLTRIKAGGASQQHV